MLGSGFLFGYATALVFMPRISDVFGRKRIYRICAGAQIIPVFLFLFANDINQMVALYTFIGVTRAATENVWVIYMMEFVRRSH